MRDEVVDGTALNTKWIPMALSGFFDSGDGPMLSFDFAGEMVVVDSCLASFARQHSSGVAKKNHCLALDWGCLRSQ